LSLPKKSERWWGQGKDDSVVTETPDTGPFTG
jgi:hypothetical protein